MLWSRKRSLPDLCTDLAEATMRLDERASRKAIRAIAGQAEAAGAAELTEGVQRFVPALEQVAVGNGGRLAQLTAGLIEFGADPFPVLDILVERLAEGLEQAARFPVLADKLGDGLTAHTRPTRPAEAAALRDRVTRAAPAAGLDTEEAVAITQAWFTVNDWIPSLLLPLQQKRVRQALPERARLTEAAAAMTEHAEDAPWLLGLLAVLDDEQLVVVHRETGRAYSVTISGVGDNFQLHTLLAATLIGDPAQGLIGGERPHHAWVAAATDGELAPPGGLRGQFNLVDANGEWIWNEGRPADIPLAGGRRVVVLDPPPYQRSWNIGRAYPLMMPEIRLDRVLPADEAAGWIQRIRPVAERR
ncbi:hypothetical protein [Micromonospora sp. DPT]|uniref:hypothetical protein n=1 Tax=Micromonospora sp. DPT TaxID=3142975 RepID=UPI0032082A44